MILARRLFLAALFVVGGACSSPTLTPTAVHGTFALLTVDGEPLPVAVYVHAGDTVYVERELLSLRADRTGSRLSETRLVRPGQPPMLGTGASDVTYRIRGATLEISTLCPAAALCAEPPVDRARFEGDRLIVERGIDGRTYVYERRNPFFR